MQFEQNIELRHAYISSLSQLITNISCSKWCESLARIITDYCGNHTDLRTLKISLEVRYILKHNFAIQCEVHNELILIDLYLYFI